MRKQILAASILFSCCLAPLASAETVLPAASENSTPEPISRFEQYLRDFDQKFDRGGFNFVAGWTELVRQPILHYKSEEKKNRTLMTVKGLGVGLWNSLADTIGGFGNALTSVWPGWEIPLPEGGVTSGKITGGNPDSFQSKDEYKTSSSSKTPRALYTN